MTQDSLVKEFNEFEKGLSENIANIVNGILQQKSDKKIYSIAFITTDDFYGIYVTSDYLEKDKAINIWESFEWQGAVYPKCMYQPLVDIVENNNEIDFTTPSDEKWQFAQTLISILNKHIQNISEDVFGKNGYKREDIIFFITMSDGDYVDAMLKESVKTFNSSETLKRYEINID